MVKLETIQTRIIDTIHGLLDNDLFIAGYLEYPSAGTNSFNFKATDPKNKFKLTEHPYIPTDYSDFIGKIAPTDKLFDSSGSVGIKFGLPMRKNFKDHYKQIEQLAADTSGSLQNFELDGTTYKLVLSSTPVSSPTPPQILDGERILFVTLVVNYKVLSNGFLGNETTISIIPNGAISPPEELVITGGTLSVADILISTQPIASAGVKNIPGNRSFQATLTFYELDGILSTVLEQRLAEVEPAHIDFVFIKVYKDITTRQLVLIENVNKPIDVGTVNLYSVTFRTSAEELVLETEAQGRTMGLIK